MAELHIRQNVFHDVAGRHKIVTFQSNVIKCHNKPEENL